MPHLITDSTEIRNAVQRLEFQANIPDKLLTEWLEGVKINRLEKMSGPMVRLRSYSPGEMVMKEGEWGGNNFCVLVEGKLDVYMRDEQTNTQYKVNTVKPGESFGEMSLFAGVPRTATVIASGPPVINCESLVLEIDRPALRSAKQKEKGSSFTQELFERVGTIYQERGLSTVVEQIRKATGFSLSPEQIQSLQSISRFRVYGRSHRLCQQGAEISKIFLIRNGWVRRDYDVPFAEERSVVASAMAGENIDFVGSGVALGLQSLTADSLQWEFTGMVMLRTEAMEIDVALLRGQPGIVRAMQSAFSQSSAIDKSERVATAIDPDELVTTEDLVTSGIVEAENVLVMDMDLCIRCGNCSLACQKVHGNSRLVRRGIHITRIKKPPLQKSEQHILVPQVCIHCQDPECLTYCPTGAIHRGTNGQIDINQDTCTGCLQCAQRCPYSAITMISGISTQRDVPGLAAQMKGWLGVSPPFLPPAEQAKKNLIATKCNLCENTSLNPAGTTSTAYSCEENCPTGALVRVNPREYFDEVERRLGSVFRSEMTLKGRNIHRRDPIRRWLHLLGILFILITVAGGIGLWWKHGFDQSLPMLSMTLRWLTGILGAIGLLAASTYSIRRRIYGHRAGPLRYWMLAHAYLGGMAAVAIMLHGAGHGGGFLTTVLMLMFDFTLITGLFGIASYYIAPRILTSIEGDPLLLEDLEARRTELRNDLSALLQQAIDLGGLLDKARRRIESLGFFLQQIFYREELSAMLAVLREQYPFPLERHDPEKRILFMASIEKLATLRRLDALIFLHRLMKVWIPPHIIAASLMLALLLIHIAQVSLFSGR